MNFIRICDIKEMNKIFPPHSISIPVHIEFKIIIEIYEFY